MRFEFKIFLASLAITAISTLHFVDARGDRASDEPFELFEEDGTSLGMMHVRGGNLNHWIEDMKGYTVCSIDGGGIRNRHLTAKRDAISQINEEAEIEMKTVKAKTRMKMENLKEETKIRLEAIEKEKNIKMEAMEQEKEVHHKSSGKQLPSNAKEVSPSSKATPRSIARKWYYCQWKDETKTDVIASVFAVAETDPYETNLERHIHKHRSLPKRVNRRELANRRKLDRLFPHRAPSTGTIKNLVVLMKFADHTSKVLPTKDDFDVMLNSEEKDSERAPFGSMKTWYRNVSGNKINVESTIIDWVTLDFPYTEAYCADGESGFHETGEVLINECLPHVLSKIGDQITDEYDVNNDGAVDALTFFHSGYCASNNGNNDWIWSHKWSTYYEAPTGMEVYDYNINPAFEGTSGNELVSIATPVHEFGHVLGLPDFYDTDNSSAGLGYYSAMADCDGAAYDGNPNQFDPWSKIALGWADAEILSQSATGIVLEPSYTHHKYYKIVEGFPDGEYLLIENRQRILSDKSFENEGILIYHIDENMVDDPGDNAFNTKEGHAGQPNYPRNNKHYHNHLEAADGKFDLERETNHGDWEDFFNEDGVSQITPGNQYPNTNAYQGGKVYETGISIKNIRHEIGSRNMLFDLSLPSDGGIDGGNTGTPDDGGGNTGTPDDDGGNTGTPDDDGGNTGTPDDDGGNTGTPDDDGGNTGTPDDDDGNTGTAADDDDDIFNF